MKFLNVLVMLVCLNWALSQSADDELIVEEVNQEEINQKTKEKHKVLDEQQEDSEIDNKEQVGQFILEFIEKYDTEKTGKISLEDYKQFLEDIYVNSFQFSSEEDNEAMRLLIGQFIEEDKQQDYVTYDEIKEDVNGPGFTNFFEKKLKENMKKQDEYLQELIDNAGGELVDEKVVDNQEELDQLQKNMKSDL